MIPNQLALLLAIKKIKAAVDEVYPSGPSIQLSASTIPEDAALNDVVGTLSVANLGALTVSSYAITADPDDVFDLDGADLIVDGALDYETATSHSVTIEATLSDASTVNRTFSISVTDVSEGGGDIGELWFDDAQNSGLLVLLEDI